VYGTQIFRNGVTVPFGAALVSETTVFREFGPLSGSTSRVSYEFAPKIGSSLSKQTADIDARYYKRLGATGLLALRAKGFRSWGDFPDFFFFGGNSELRGYDYLQFAGHKGFFTNAELRFPLIEAMLTPLGVLGGIRGVFFAGLGAAGFNNQDFKVWRRDTESISPVVDFLFNPVTGQFEPVYGPTQNIAGFRLVNGRASYGIGLESFLLGFPIHFDWSWRTLFNKQYEDSLFAYDGGSSKFRRPRFALWIGYDF
jgi:outer membrane protein assembly factor BamA